MFPGLRGWTGKAILCSDRRQTAPKPGRSLCLGSTRGAILFSYFVSSAVAFVVVFCFSL